MYKQDSKRSNTNQVGWLIKPLRLINFLTPSPEQLTSVVSKELFIRIKEVACSLHVGQSTSTASERQQRASKGRSGATEDLGGATGVHELEGATAV